MARGASDQSTIVAARWLSEFDARISNHRQPRRARANGRIGLIYMRPVTTTGLLIDLAHELGHVAFKHGKQKLPRYVGEFQACAFQAALLARDGIVCPLKEIETSRWYVGQKISQRHSGGGGGVDHRIAAWSLSFDVDRYPHYKESWSRYRPRIEAAVAESASTIDYYTATLERLGEMGLSDRGIAL
jgi:hypothetical protein